MEKESSRLSGDRGVRAEVEAVGAGRVEAEVEAIAAASGTGFC